MNYIITAKPPQLPIYPDRPVTRPVTEVAESASEFRDASQQTPSAHVYRGELLDAIAGDKLYRPQPNLQIDPRNRRAIETYQRVTAEPPLTGQILDGFI